MTYAIKTKPSLAEENLAARRIRLARLSEKMAEAELELTELRTRIAAFQQRFFRLVGHKYAELDDLRARLAEIRARHQKNDEFWQDAARRSRARAEQSAHDYQRFAGETAPPASPPPPSPDLRKLYRTIAAQIHPDKAPDRESRHDQTRLMAELNAAYTQRDRPRMEEIWNVWKKQAALRERSALAAELHKIEQAIARIRERLGAMRSEKRKLESSEDFHLMRQTEEARAEGRDLLAELADELDAKITACRLELADAA